MSVIAPNKKTAVVLFNLGGPDTKDAVQPFLNNLFNDPAIIGLPNPMRGWLAKFISTRRAPKAQHIYDLIGGKSPILENTQAQADALEASLKQHGNVRVFIAMRYWHPRAAECVKQVQQFSPDNIILLPLYPQFSTTTTGSSFDEWRREAARAKLDVPTHAVCCYPTQPEFVAAHAALIKTYYDQAAAHGKPRILFSAHGLPEKVIAKGDPYQSQVEMTTRAVLGELKIPEVDYVNCYQSRVGPLKWIGPSTEHELTRAAADKVPVVLVPIAFVSEHSETLVELDIEYAEMAKEAGLEHYFRVPTLSGHAHFIAALADICLKQTAESTIAPDTGTRICEARFGKCVCK